MTDHVEIELCTLVYHRTEDLEVQMHINAAVRTGLQIVLRAYNWVGFQDTT